MKVTTTFISSIAILLLFFACSPVNTPPPVPDQFKEYWYQGKAEVTSYELEQARYGELRNGHAVLVFVTEEFSKDKQVKLDNPYEHPKDALRVLKLNSIRKFSTGIYPYSIMLSVFNPVASLADHDALKATVSSQEWCGHTFQQMNLRGKKYRVLQRSYFESEGDREYNITDVWLEDELWNLIRISPDKLPQGEIQVVPGMITARLTHQKLEPIVAETNIIVDGDISTFSVRYSASGRTLKIHYKTVFPHAIEGWEETYQSGNGPDARMITTKAVKKERDLLAYWNLNSTRDSVWRDSLGLSR